jgi:hypothetical protein
LLQWRPRRRSARVGRGRDLYADPAADSPRERAAGLRIFRLDADRAARLPRPWLRFAATGLELFGSVAANFLRRGPGSSDRAPACRVLCRWQPDGSSWTAPQTNAVNAYAVQGVQYISPALGATVVGIGDSIMTSSCKASQSSGFGIRACAIVSTPPQLPVSYVNQGYPARNSSGFCSCATWIIQHLKPQAALIQPGAATSPGPGRWPICPLLGRLRSPIRRAATAACRS